MKQDLGELIGRPALERLIGLTAKAANNPDDIEANDARELWKLLGTIVKLKAVGLGAELHHASRRRGGVALVARAQQGERVRRIGVLMGFADNDPEARLWIARFTQGLSELGRIVGRNLQMDIRWDTDSSMDQRQISAKELVSLQPDVILSSTTKRLRSTGRGSAEEFSVRRHANGSDRAGLVGQIWTTPYNPY